MQLIALRDNAWQSLTLTPKEEVSVYLSSGFKG